MARGKKAARRPPVLTPEEEEPLNIGRRRDSLGRSPSYDALKAVSPRPPQLMQSDPLETMFEEEQETLGKTLGAIVKVITKHTEPNFSLPWQMRHQVNT